jgi:hypothetical protein
VEAEDKVIVDAPIVSDLVFELDEEKLEPDIENPPVSNAPAVRVIVPLHVNASCRVHPPPTPLKTRVSRVLPFVVIVLPVVVALNVIVAAAPKVRPPVGNVAFP